VNETTDAERKRFSLHPGQVDIWTSPARYKVVVAGRRWGKTHLVRTWLLALALRGKPGRYWYIAPTRDDAKDIMWADLKDACDERWLAKPPREGDLALELTNGAEIRIWSAEKDSGLKGRRLRALVLDEYADMDRRVFDEILRPSLTDFGAPVMFIGTPRSHNHFYEFYERGSNEKFPRWASWQFRSLDNPFLPKQEIEEARAEMDARTFRQEYEASFEAAEGRIYYAFARDLDVRPVALDPHLPVCISFDFNVNPATAVLGQARQDECRVWREVWVTHAGGEATRAAATKARDLLREAGWHGAIRLYGDASGASAKTTGPSDHAAIRDVFPGASWHMPRANGHVRDRYAAVNARAQTSDGQRHLTIDPSCRHLVADLEQVTFAESGEADKKSNPLLTHVSDAFGYWVVYDWPVVRKTTGGAGYYPHLDL